MRYDVGAALAGLVFALLGTAFLLDAVDVAAFRFDLVLPAAAIVLGVGAILSSLLRPRDS